MCKDRYGDCCGDRGLQNQRYEDCYSLRYDDFHLLSMGSSLVDGGNVAALRVIYPLQLAGMRVVQDFRQQQYE